MPIVPTKNLSTPHSRPPPPLSPEEYRAELKRKGWTYARLEERWGLSANWLVKVAGKVDRPRHWDDAVRGLPDISAGSAAARPSGQQG